MCVALPTGTAYMTPDALDTRLGFYMLCIRANVVCVRQQSKVYCAIHKPCRLGFMDSFRGCKPNPTANAPRIRVAATYNCSSVTMLQNAVMACRLIEPLHAPLSIARMYSDQFEHRFQRECPTLWYGLASFITTAHRGMLR